MHNVPASLGNAMVVWSATVIRAWDLQHLLVQDAFRHGRAEPLDIRHQWLEQGTYIF